MLMITMVCLSVYEGREEIAWHVAGSGMRHPRAVRDQSGYSLFGTDFCGRWEGHGNHHDVGRLAGGVACVCSIIVETVDICCMPMIHGALPILQRSAAFWSGLAGRMMSERMGRLCRSQSRTGHACLLLRRHRGGSGGGLRKAMSTTATTTWWKLVVSAGKASGRRRAKCTHHLHQASVSGGGWDETKHAPRRTDTPWHHARSKAGRAFVEEVLEGIRSSCL
ncbi:hypothetical protein B0T22DRAFT_180890 [Podospora appendiculata]|uniref:Uncharacterized protein n=1 Tax=Podospora appendiculata TaxID=314037 RepID=A0AAE1CDQ7_9PEZI|nr:hypothetical protein B0T22DRAFT_180890 [Podospora appendiculata]